MEVTGFNWNIKTQKSEEKRLKKKQRLLELERWNVQHIIEQNMDTKKPDILKIKPDIFKIKK